MLYELAKQEFRRIGGLANVVDHNRVVVDAVLQGHYNARVFVDDSSNPSAALICPHGAFTYMLLSAPCSQFLQDVQQLLFEELKVEGIELLAYPEVKPAELDHILGGRPYVKLVRRDYRLNMEKFLGLGNSLKLLPNSDFSMRKIDSAFIQAFTLDLLPGQSQDEFLNHSFGYAVVRGKELISHCVLAFESSADAELSVKTNERYRRQGLALPVCKAVIDRVLAEGLNPTWSCWEFNEASCNLAEKLGFELNNIKQLYLWDKWVQKKHEK